MIAAQANVAWIDLPPSVSVKAHFGAAEVMPAPKRPAFVRPYERQGARSAICMRGLKA